MTTLKVQKRDMEIKAKKLRREGFVTGSLFGKEFDGAIPLKIEQKEAERIQRECLKGSQLYLELDGKTYDVLLKELDYDPMKHQIIEMDFQALVKGEKVHSVAEIVLHNKDKVVDGVLEQLLSEISYKAVPEAIVDRVDVDCSKLRLGDTLKVSDLEIAQDKNVDIMTHMDTPVVSVIASRNVVPDAEETAEDEK
ncbi:MAG: 50S ribosomal protein L25 [Lachnospiraceae bacterium]|nr:50S ribosomal protein L25 [Lachnospiraceae bacterium]MDD6627708.1 50S ribosomal protein L25 [Lachnospiraceae bacterium]